MDPALAQYPDAMLMVELYRRAAPVAAELDTTPSAWLHRQVEFIAEAVASTEHDKRRAHLKGV